MTRVLEHNPAQQAELIRIFICFCTSHCDSKCESQNLNLCGNINFQSHFSQKCHNINHVDVCFNMFKTFDSSKVWYFNISSSFCDSHCESQCKDKKQMNTFKIGLQGWIDNFNHFFFCLFKLFKYLFPSCKETYTLLKLLLVYKFIF